VLLLDGASKEFFGRFYRTGNRGTLDENRARVRSAFDGTKVPQRNVGGNV